MRRKGSGFLMVLPTAMVLLASQAMAHFVFVVPQKEDAGQVKVVFSETLEAEDEVDVLLVKGVKLQARDMTGKTTDLEPGTKQGNALLVKVPGQGTRVVHGTVDLGYMQRGQSKPHVLIYHTKAIVGDSFDVAATILNHPVVELLAVGRPGAMQFQYNIEGKPAAKAQLTVVMPDGSEKKVITGEDGRSPVFTEAGSYGVWGRHWVDTQGERDGKKIEQIRHYAMLVVVIPAP